MSDHNEAMRLAVELVAPIGTQTSYQTAHEAAALLRKQSERIAELEADYQRLMDKHNALHVNALKHRAERDTLRAEVERLRVDAERWGKFIGLSYQVRAEWAANLSLVPVLTEWVDSLPAIDLARTTHKETE